MRALANKERVPPGAVAQRPFPSFLARLSGPHAKRRLVGIEQHVELANLGRLLLAFRNDRFHHLRVEPIRLQRGVALFDRFGDVGLFPLEMFNRLNVLLQERSSDPDNVLAAADRRGRVIV